MTLQRVWIRADQLAFMDGQPRRVRGVANTFGVMHSGRMLHPSCLDEFLQQNPDAQLPLLAQHGWQGVGGFSTIGKVAMMKVTRDGLVFEAELAEGTTLAEEAATLIQQGALKGVSLGWQSKADRWANINEPDLDPAVKKALKSAGRDGCWLFLKIVPVEISIVDVGDDPGAVLAARVQQEVESALAPLMKQVETICAAFTAARPAELRIETADGLIERAVAAARQVTELYLKAYLKDFATGMTNAVEAMIETKLEDLRGCYLESLGDATDGGACGSETEADADEPAKPASVAWDKLLKRLPGN